MPAACCCPVRSTACPSAAVDPEGGVMYLYGGVTVQQKNNARVPADSEAGMLHAFDFATYTWSTIKTTGVQ